MGMNDQSPEGRSGCPESAPCPTCLARLRLAPPSPRFRARPASALSLEELGRKARAGDSGARRPKVRYCSFSDSGSPPLAQGCWQGHSGPATDPAPRPSCPFPHRSSEEGREERCWSSGSLRAAGALGGGRMWSCAREGRPPAIYPNLCPGGWVPSLTTPPPHTLRCWFGQVFVPAV